MTRRRRLAAIAASVSLAISGAAWAGCGDDESEQVEDAVNEALDEAQQQSDEIEQQVEEASEEAQQQAEEAQKDADKALEDAEKEADQAEDDSGGYSP